MGIPGSAAALLFGQSSEDGEYIIPRSLRFTSGETSHLSKSFSSAGNRRRWTWSAWVKKARVGEEGNLFTVGASSTDAKFRFNANDTLEVSDGSGGQLTTAALFRDTSAWYHFVVVLDNTQVAAADRFKLYVNGVEATVTGAPSSHGTRGAFNQATNHYIGRQVHNASNLFNGYLADVHFIDGKALAPENFGVLDEFNVWQPKAYAASYGWFNTSQTWSNLVTGTLDTVYGNSSAAAPFQGSTGTAYSDGIRATTGNYLSMNFGSTFATATRVTIYGHASLDGVTYNGTNENLKINGTALTSAEWANNGGSGGQSSATFTLSNGLTSLEWGYGAGSQSSGYLYLQGIEVDGKLLTNSGVSVTDNSFYLDFADNSSNAALGTDTSGNSNTWTVNNMNAAGSGWDRSQKWSNDMNAERLNKPYLAFDGDLSTYAHASASAGTITWTPTGGHSYTNSVRVFAYANYGGQNSNVYLNGGTPVVVGAFNGWVTVATGSGTITSISNSYDNTYRGLIVAIEVDGKILVDSDIVDPLTLGIDSLVDSPTDGDPAADTGLGGELASNYAVLNPLHKGEYASLTNGNLDCVSSSSWGTTISTIGVSTGKWYAELTISGTTVYPAFGVSTLDLAYPGSYLGQQAGSYCWFAYANAGLYTGGNYINTTSTWRPDLSAGDVIGLALDMDNGTLKYYLNDSLVGGGNAFTGITGTQFFATCSVGHTESWNFGQRPWRYAAPTNFKALCTANLPEPTIPDGRKFVSATTYEGTSGTKIVGDLLHSPDFVWVKKRSGGSHFAYDTIRGFSNGNAYELRPSGNNGQGVPGAANSGLTSFNSDGFTLGSDGGANGNGDAFIAWTFDAGANSNRTYTVTVVNDGGNKYRFDGNSDNAVTLDLAEGSTYTFDQSHSSNLGHPLRFGTSSNGTNYTTGVTHTGTPGSAGAKTTLVLGSGVSTLYYSCQHHSGMGGQINTNSTEGSTVLRGSVVSSLYNQDQTWSNYVTGTPYSGNYPVTNAFNNDLTNRSLASGSAGHTFTPPTPLTVNSSLRVYFGYTDANATNVFKVNGTDYSSLITNTGSNTGWVTVPGITTLTSLFYGVTPNGSEDSSVAAIEVDGRVLVDSGISVPANVGLPSETTILKANPEAGFSITRYAGAGTTSTIAHGLNYPPSVVIQKRITAGDSWHVYHIAAGNTHYGRLENSDKFYARTANWNDTSPTSSLVTLGNDGGVNGTGQDYLALCFAPVEGYSAFGSYVATNTNPGPFVWLSFRPAFVIVKRYSSAGLWYLFDSSRDPENAVRHQLNTTTDAEYSGSPDRMDFLSNGFSLKSGTSDPNSTGTYLYLAWASNPFKSARAY